jgi:hypothetical protein
MGSVGRRLNITQAVLGIHFVSLGVAHRKLQLDTSKDFRVYMVSDKRQLEN